MGSVKDDMKPTKKKKDDVTDLRKGADLLFGMIKRKSKDVTPPKEQAQTFTDMLVSADERLRDLIQTKSNDLVTESGKEDYNRRALALLSTMEFHLDQIINAAADYAELK